MQSKPQENKIWRETRLSRLSAMLRLVLDAVFAAIVICSLFLIDGELVFSPAGLVGYLVLFAVAIYKPVSRFRNGVAWNSEGIRSFSLFGRGKLHRWSDLRMIEPDMHKRATILAFNPKQKTKVYWGFEGYRDIVDFAEERLNENARTS